MQLQPMKYRGRVALVLGLLSMLCVAVAPVSLANFYTVEDDRGLSSGNILQPILWFFSAIVLGITALALGRRTLKQLAGIVQAGLTPIHCKTSLPVFSTEAQAAAILGLTSNFLFMLTAPTCFFVAGH